jgi:hypothetical protein
MKLTGPQCIAAQVYGERIAAAAIVTYWLRERDAVCADGQIATVEQNFHALADLLGYDVSPRAPRAEKVTGDAA